MNYMPAQFWLNWCISSILGVPIDFKIKVIVEDFVRRVLNIKKKTLESKTALNILDGAIGKRHVLVACALDS